MFAPHASRIPRHLVAAFAVLLSGCEPPPTSGPVIDLGFDGVSTSDLAAYDATASGLATRDAIIADLTDHDALAPNSDLGAKMCTTAA